MTALSRRFKTLGLHPSTWSLSEYLLLAILLLATFLRLWNLPESLQFQGDQGRDALIVSQIWLERDPVLIGPVTSVGNMYLGPLYYYFMLPWLWLSYPSPLGPAVAVAVLSIVSVWLAYELGRRYWSKSMGLFWALLLSGSWVLIEYTRFSWNPNLAPLFSLCLLWAVQKTKRSPYWWLVVTVCLSVLIQLHYLIFLAVAGSGLIFLSQFWESLRQDRARLGQLGLSLLGSLLITLLFISPLILFDLRHDFLNYRSFVSLFTTPEAFSGDRSLLLIIREAHGRAMHILLDFAFGQHRLLNTLLLLAGLSGLLVYLQRNALQKSQSLFLHHLLLLVFTAIWGTAFYKHSVFQHYLLYIFPLSLGLYAIFLAELWKRWWGKILASLIILLFFISNAPRYPLKSLGWTISDVRETAEVIAAELPEEGPYVLVLLSESRDLYGMSYRYYLHSVANTPPLPPERFQEAEQLVIVNENQQGVDVLKLPIYEIQTFYGAQLEKQVQIPGGPVLEFVTRAKAGV